MVWLAALLFGAAQVAAEPPVVRASAPSDIAVTMYRDPYRGRDGAIDARNPNGFALITETRTVRLAAGESTVRFEGVADGMIPVSAVIDGLPGGTVEKNRDARLLSPASLVDGTLGRRVTLRRTDRATGAVREEQATILAGPTPGIVLRTTAGIETLRCSGLPEKLVHAGVPPTVSADPVLSVTTRSPRAAKARVTLSYLATDFDWGASYVATLRPDGSGIDLFAWMTLANANRQGFPAARVNAVAGRLERRFLRQYRAAVPALSLRCYPLGTTTSDLPEYEAEDADEIMVTGSRMMMAEAVSAPPPPPPPAPPPPPPPPEDLGDLKLYRVPERVSVAANQQKQVALLRRDAVRVERVYAARLFPGAAAARPTAIELRMANDAAAGLGVPLPAGTTALYGTRDGARVLLGLGRLDDIAVGGKVWIGAGASTQVMVEQRFAAGAGAVTVTNANAQPATVEVRLGAAGDTSLRDFSADVARVDGVWTWRATVPGQGTAVLSYRVEQAGAAARK
ncbi:DUF4139 domain-containing protein [Sphingomonas sp. Leaf33]|uniref:DUF4139 domain-containing protein n=1 Tax=Sphingomonas sp. Leaf33 TaxID=1736215 RepID=UPI000AADABA7|nr:hypothetical protein [Sphingomonas sp. Leaf33]